MDISFKLFLFLLTIRSYIFENFLLCSCKDFHDIAEDRYIYQCVSLDNFPIVAWTPLNEKQLAFLAKCEECDNPELIFRQVVVDYFGGKERKSAVSRLDRALKLEHPGILYLSCILLIFSDDNELKEQGAKWLCRCRKLRRELRVYRDKLIEILRTIWIESSLFEHRPFYCATRDDHKRKTSWPDNDEEEALLCKTCSINNEIRSISSCF
ncbi:hypothetical protein BUALT_Bualt17G0071700 [Buddleja alternifolia]|uniref:At2g35280-like TPR domain-containing protein n=1 Tax=Buddleja alternifolia TaxID=168488 RepID=A0AAV6WH92_9LAMI|nr:hypothetical protein BUALT_Bualt17G0071700 [Buddleja alternifolia]